LPIQPIQGLDPKHVALGERLFFDPALSIDGSISCSSCHDPATGGDDGLQFSVGVGGQLGGVNAPTVLNAVFNFRQFWDGRADNLNEQIDGPIHNPIEMASNWEHIVGVLREDPTYRDEFRSAFNNDNITVEQIRTAIVRYEESLTTPNSKFDQWLHGDDAALTERELQGYRAFKEYQCTSCHQGVNLGGNMYQRLGVMENYFARREYVLESDLGRFNVTKDELDRHVFRVPSLRNIDLTAPYFHDGSAETLDDAVRIMVSDQLGRPVVKGDIDLIVEFLKTLTGELPESVR
jgi:cytochrome c peroxidase